MARRRMPAGNPTNTTEASNGHESSNGATPTYDPIVEITAQALPALVTGVNVLAIGVWNNDPDSSDLALVPYLSINRPVTPPGEVHWTLASSPVNVDSSLTIPYATVLRIDPGVAVRFASGASLTVRGQIEAADAGFAGTISLAFHSETVPAEDSAGIPRTDLLTLPDSGSGTATYYDIGALELAGPDDCDTAPPAQFVRGGANDDGALDISDPVRILFVLFAGTPSGCEDALDVNDDGALNLSDAIRLLEYLFRAGAPPAAPYPAAGADPTPGDPLGCEGA